MNRSRSLPIVLSLFCAAVICSSALEAQTLVAHTGAQLGANGGTTSAINCSGANFVAVEVHYYTGSSGAPSVSDSSGNSYTALTNHGTSSLAIRMFYAQNATTSSSFTVAVSGTSIYASATVVCFSGMATSGVFQSGTDQGNASSAGPVTLEPSTSINYSANSVIITGLTVGSATTATATGPPTYTITDQPQFSTSNFEGGALAYSIQT